MGKVGKWNIYKGFYVGAPQRGKRDGVIRHILERQNGNWMEKIAIFRDTQRDWVNLA